LAVDAGLAASKPLKENRALEAGVA